MFIESCNSKFVALDNGLSFYFQQRDDGGVEYDVFRTRCTPIDGGILDDESLEDGIYMDTSFLQGLVNQNLFSHIVDRVEDHVILVMENEAADTLRECIPDFGCDEETLEDLAGRIDFDGKLEERVTR